MASTKRPKLKLQQDAINSLYIGILSLKEQMEGKIKEWEKQTGDKFPFIWKDVDTYDYINPQHYVQDDGKQTWERMIDDFGLEETAIFCKLNAYKYKDRMGKKPNEDVEREMKKIQWYEDKAEELYAQLEKEKKNKNWF